MSVTRRTGLGAIVGAIFGAPAAANVAQEKISDLMARSVMVGGSTKDQFIGGAQSSYDIMPNVAKSDPIEQEAKRIAHIQDLTRRAKGELNEHEQEEIERCNKLYTARIPLKSVSKSYKTIMRKNIEIDRQRKEWKEDARKSLLRYFGITLS